SVSCAFPMAGTTILTSTALPRKSNALSQNLRNSRLNASQTRCSPRRQHDSGGVHGAAVFDAHQPMAHGVFPDRHARASAPPRLHGLPIGTAVSDVVEELEGQGRRGGLLGGLGACFLRPDDL